MSAMSEQVPAIEAAIAAAAARCLRGSTPFDLDQPFGLLGMDSLGTIEMAAALEDTLGRTLPPELLLDCPDGRSLAERIARIHASGPVASAADPFDRMFADAVLPGDVRPPRRERANTDLRRAKRILLTGATGFLGGALLRELTETTTAEVLCLVRAVPDGPGSSPDHRLGHAPDARYRVVTGDLSTPRLGLTPLTFDGLAASVDAVVHCGAAVNWIYPYSGLRAANVLGTLELLRLASRWGVPFHFVSSLSVCYSSSGPRTAGETFDALPHLRGIGLGYAQTKVVAEALVREAGRRGLPVRIYRPALIAGHSETGAYNRDDLVSALVRGCVRMGTAPDLDWTLDCQPVDSVARSIVQLSRATGPVFHLAHERPRHWRECVLWMRMYGYTVRLVPYHAWLRQLDRETGTAAPDGTAHPLRPLRSFFLDREADAQGLTLPERYEETRRTHATSGATRARLVRGGIVIPPLDADLLETYIGAFRDRGDLPAPAVPHPRGASARSPLPLGPQFFSRLLDRPVREVRVLGSGSDHSIVSELTTWRSKRASGLFRIAADLDDGSTLRLRLKVKAADTDVTAVGEALAGLLDPSVGDAYARSSGRIGFAASHLREIEIYRQQDPRFTTHAPALLGSLSDDASGTWVVALEEIRDARHLDSADGGAKWTTTDLEAAIDGLASLHASWFDREAELRRQPWIGYVQTSQGMADMSDLWTALADHAAPAFSSWAAPDIVSLQRRLIDAIPRWWPDLESGPRTLIHHDFNPRNVCLRPDGRGARLCAYDWELATPGAPQRDLAELLCFVLPEDAPAAEVQQWIDYHRLALERETGRPIDCQAWQRGFRAGLYDLMINRLAIYALVHRVRPQHFLPRVVLTWRHLYECFPLERHE